MVTINFYGVRGSYPTAEQEMMQYGGDTACVEIVKKNKQGVMVPVIVDGGTGLIRLGRTMTPKIIKKEYSASFPILFTHYHLDHIEGYKFFTPNFLKSCTIHLLGMKTAELTPELVLKQIMAHPIFPISYTDFKAVRTNTVLGDGDVFYISQEGEPVWEKEDPLYEIQVLQAFAPSHPQQGALYFKVIDCEDGTAVACVWDIESHRGGDTRVINFIQDADVLIHDTQYTDEQYYDRNMPVQGFGHSTYAMAIENALEGKVRYLVAIHYDPTHDDTFLEGIKKRYEGKNPFTFIMAQESLSLDVGKDR
ncbi:MBL fold metallo-hydrolase [Spirochaetia bacterium]|nr:MBL fold metallo-hydrolase [Spirochaetia bacterium]